MLDRRHAEVEARKAEVQIHRHGKRHRIGMGPHGQRCSNTLSHAGSGVGVALVVRVAVVESKRGRGTGLDHDQSRPHCDKDLAPTIVGDFDRLPFVRGREELEFWIPLEAAGGAADVDDNKGRAVVAGGGVGAGIRLHRDRDLAGGTGGDQS